MRRSTIWISSTCGIGRPFISQVARSKRSPWLGGWPCAPLSFCSMNLSPILISSCWDWKVMTASSTTLPAKAGVNVIFVVGPDVEGVRALIAVIVQDRAFLSTNCLVHQFVRIGTLSLMQGGSGISKDLPPFTIARGLNGICGLNVVGLRRAGVTAEQRLELKKLYRVLFRSDLRLKEALEQAGQPTPDSPAAKLIEFAASTTRGLCADKGRSTRDTAQ